MNVGDKVRIIKRNPGNDTGEQDFYKPNGDVGKVGIISELTDEGGFVVEDSNENYLGIFSEEEVELAQDYIVFYNDGTGEHITIVKNRIALELWLRVNSDKYKVTSIREIGREVEVIETRTFSVK